MIVTYNRKDLTKDTLECIFNNTKFPYKLIFVDNGSEDGTPEYLEKTCKAGIEKYKAFKGYKIKANKNNRGIAIGRNQALSISASNWLCTFDNDVWVPDGWLTECVDILKKNRQFASIGVNMEPTTYPMVNLGGKVFQEKPQGNLGTACMVFNRSLHKMLGWFNYLDYGLYGEEDADWGMRTRVVGLKLGYIKENGKHMGENEKDVGEYREFKTASHTRNLAKFNANCRAYMRRDKPLFISFVDNE
jgi:GT2 family glycosyltransferase